MFAVATAVSNIRSGCEAIQIIGISVCLNITFRRSLIAPRQNLTHHRARVLVGWTVCWPNISLSCCSFIGVFGDHHVAPSYGAMLTNILLRRFALQAVKFTPSRANHRSLRIRPTNTGSSIFKILAILTRKFLESVANEAG